MRQARKKRKGLVWSSMLSTCLLLPGFVASTHLALAQVVKLLPSDAGVVTVRGQTDVPLDTGEKSNVITAEEITYLPVDGRDTTELLKTLRGFAIQQGVNGTVSNQAADPSQMNVTRSIGNEVAFLSCFAWPTILLSPEELKALGAICERPASQIPFSNHLKRDLCDFSNAVCLRSNS